MSISVQGLTKMYGTQRAVNNISFEIKKGEIVGFLGPNGAGKSTTMKIITGSIPCNAGVVKVCDLDTTAHPLQVKAKIGYLPEANPLYYDMYVKEYLSFVAGMHRLGDIKEKVQHVIALTGLSVEQHKKAGQLSKGYKQRVGLAAALIHDPEVLILDEPGSGLDPNQIIEIRNVIKDQGKNKTVLFSSHILQEVEAVCDRVIIINRGEIVADNALSTLKSEQSASHVLVSFREKVQEVWLRQIVSVSSIENISANTWKLTTTDTAATRKQLLELTLRENLNIESLQTSGSNLEEIFRSLTVQPAR